MFDNHTNPPAGAVPPNLPTAEPDDMFAGAGVDTPLPEPSNTPPTALDAGVLRPVTEMPAAPSIPTAPAMPMASVVSTPPRRESAPMTSMPAAGMDNSDGVLSAPLGGHKALVAAIVILSLIIVGGGSAWAYVTFINPPDVQMLPNNTTQVVPESNTNEEDAAVLEKPTSTVDVVTDNTTSTDSLILFGEPVLDTDNDGLDDSVEKEKGTDMLVWDTDGDSLSDGDEILTWKTDPLKADTDGDTYEDAAEIKNGYNPSGPGKLFAVPIATTTPVTAETKP